MNEKLKARIAKRKKIKANKRLTESTETKKIRNEARARVAAGRTIHQSWWIGKTSARDTEQHRKTWKSMIGQQITDYKKWVSNWTRKAITNNKIADTVKRFSNIIQTWGQKKFKSFSTDAYKASQSPTKYSSFAKKYNPKASEALIKSQQEVVNTTQWQSRLDNVYKSLYKMPINKKDWSDWDVNKYWNNEYWNNDSLSLNNEPSLDFSWLNDTQKWYYDNWKNNQDAQQQNFLNYQQQLAQLNKWIFDIKSAWLNNRKWFANKEAQLWREQANRDRLKQIQLAEQSRNQQAWYASWAAWGLWWTTWTQALELANVADKFNLQVADINQQTANQIMKVQSNYNNVLRQISQDETLSETEKIDLQKEMAKDLSSMQATILQGQQWLFDKFYDENQTSISAQAQAQEKLRLEWVKDRTKGRETLEKNFDKFRSEIAWIVNINSDIWNKARAEMTDASLNWDMNAANEVLTNMQSNVYKNPEYKAYINATNAKKTKLPWWWWWGRSYWGWKWSTPKSLSKSFWTSPKTVYIDWQPTSVYVWLNEEWLPIYAWLDWQRIDSSAISLPNSAEKQVLNQLWWQSTESILDGLMPFIN